MSPPAAGHTVPDDARPRLAAGVRIHHDRPTGQPVLLFPEAVVELRGTGAAIVPLCDGRRTLVDVVRTLGDRYAAPAALIRADVELYLARLRDRLLIEYEGPAVAVPPAPAPPVAVPAGPPRPIGLIAEVTYRCPLHCPYCSNPVSLGGDELSTDQWCRVLSEAADLGVLHALFSGGEPLARPDLPDLVGHAQAAGLYTNLITSGVGLTEARGRSLRSAGLDSVQVSFQSDEADRADLIAGTTAHARKLDAARLVRDLGFPLTVNAVLHRSNIGRIEGLIDLADRLGARRLELASAQYYGWAVRNRTALLPTRSQVEAADRIAVAARDRLRGRMDVIYVLPDYHGDRPKPCMNGWGRQYIAVNPVGDVLPCPTAREIPSLRFENVRDRSLDWVWTHSESFNRFRGTTWMPDPCRSCDRREVDFGGCRCQAAIVTGDAAATDPVCGLSPGRPLIDLTVAAADRAAATPSVADFHYRTNPAAGLPTLRADELVR